MVPTDTLLPIIVDRHKVRSPLAGPLLINGSLTNLAPWGDHTVVADGDQGTDESVGLNTASIANSYIGLNFHEGTDERIVSNGGSHRDWPEP